MTREYLRLWCDLMNEQPLGLMLTMILIAAVVTLFVAPAASAIFLGLLLFVFVVVTAHFVGGGR